MGRGGNQDLVDALTRFDNGRGLRNFIPKNKLGLCEHTINQKLIFDFFGADESVILEALQQPSSYDQNFKLYQYIQKVNNPRRLIDALERTGNEKALEIIRNILEEAGELEDGNSGAEATEKILGGLEICKRIEDQFESYNCKNVRVLFISQIIRSIRKSDEIMDTDIKMHCADIDREHVTNLFEKTLKMTLQMEQFLDLEDIPRILKKFKQNCKKDANDGCIIIMSTYGDELYLRRHNILNPIGLERDVIQQFGQDEFPDFAGKPKIFLFHDYHDGRTNIQEILKFLAEDSSNVKYSDILIAYSTLPYHVSYLHGSCYLKFLHDVYLENRNQGKKIEIRTLLHKVGQKFAEVLEIKGSRHDDVPIPEIRERLFVKNFYLEATTEETESSAVVKSENVRMDTLAKKLEEFGLEEFINAYLFYLCQKTVSPLKVAVALNFDADQIAVISHPPDNFSKNEKLYELIPKRANEKNFLEALEETGNEHIIKFIRETDFSTASTSANPNQSRGIWFNIPEPIDSFCGREEFLSQLHDQLKPRDDSEADVTVLSQVKIVSGLGGIGKTQTARKYITQHQKLYNNFFWIDAGSENSMRNSFVKLAEEIKIPVENSEGNPREIQEVVKEIYNKICEGQKSNLIVFDSAEDYKSCKDFLPFGLHPDLTKPVILATSRNQEWISPRGKIQVLPLDVMTESESLEFILKQLEIPESEMPEFKEESREFIELIGGLPLALQLAVAYIKQKKEERKFLGTPYKISDYVQEFKLSTKKFLSFSPVPSPDSSSTAFATWNVTFEKIQKLESGEEAIKILKILSFLNADKIPSSFLHDLVPEIQDAEFSGAIKLLEKYSLVKMNVRYFCLSIHRQLQFVILQYLKESNEIPKVLMRLVDTCTVVLKNIKISKSSDIFLNIHQIVNSLFNLIPMTAQLLDFMCEFALTLSRASRYAESLDLYKKVHNNYREMLGEGHQDTIVIQHQISQQLFHLGRYDESLSLYEENLKKQEIHPDLGPDDFDTITTKHNIAMVLRQQKKYQESLMLFQEVLQQKIKVLGESHPLTLSTQSSIALLDPDLGDFPKSLALYTDVEEKQIEILGPDHRDVLITKHNKASVLYKMEKFQEASKIFKDNHEKEKGLWGANHLDTIRTLYWIAKTEEQEGKFTEALELYKQVYEIRKMELGEDHPDTINVKRKIGNVEQKLRDTSSASSSMTTEFKKHTKEDDKEKENPQTSLQETLMSSDKFWQPSSDDDDVHELESSIKQLQPFSTVSMETEPVPESKSESVYNSDSALRDKIETSLSFLCKSTINVVKFAMYLLHFEVMKEDRFHELMRLEDDDFTLCYYIYEDILELDSLPPLQKALAALNASGNDHIVKYILTKNDTE